MGTRARMLDCSVEMVEVDCIYRPLRDLTLASVARRPSWQRAWLRDIASDNVRLTSLPSSLYCRRSDTSVIRWSVRHTQIGRLSTLWMVAHNSAGMERFSL